MKKFVFIYYGGGKPDNMTMEEVKADWGKWFEELGSALVDGGNPFNDGGQSVTANSVETIKQEDWPATGYTIVNAESMKDAVEKSKGCPMHAHSKGEAMVRVYEALPM